MTVQAAGAGTTVAAAVVGAGGLAGTDPNLSSNLPSTLSEQLARTGASGTQVLVMVALMLILSGALVLGVVRRHLRVPPRPAR